ncbi:MAG: hypothetical protein KKH51_11685 [Actinobacteria bacterium]|nr:hypothetical protein [Actinomycetota bacterium]
MRTIHTQLNIMLLEPETVDRRDPDAKQVIVYGKEARWLSHLGRLDSDLTLTAKRCDDYLAAATEEEPDVDYLALAADGAFISYGRLDNGATGRFPPELFDALPTEVQAHHKWALAMRDKFVGHAVNGLNRTLPVAAVSEDRSLSYVFAMTARVVPTVTDMEQLQALAVAVSEILAPLLGAARDAVHVAMQEKGAAIWENPQPQFEVVSRDGFDYLSTAGELRGKFGLPGAL